MFILKIVVLVTSLNRPYEHPAITAYLPYPTQYTCEEARDYHLDLDAIAAGSKAIIHIPHSTIRNVKATCERSLPNI